MNTSRVSAIAAVLCASACADKVVNVRFESESIRRAVNEVRMFAFAGVSCPAVDPRGLPYGDAEARTGLTATRSAKSAFPHDTLAELDELPAGEYALVIEGWGPPCTKRGANTGDGPTCETFAREGRAILRGYACAPIALASGSPADIDVELQTTAKIGSEMRVPLHLGDDALVHDAKQPLPIVEGVRPSARFAVQLIDDNAEAIDGELVRWSIAAGSGWLEDAEVQLTERIEDGGLSSNRVFASAAASTNGDGKLIVAAYAPGFEGSPIELEARAIRGVELDVTSIELPRAKIELEGADPEFRPVVAADFDLDGRADLALTTGLGGRCGGPDATHQIAVLYGNQDGSFQAAYSAPQPKQVRALATARVDRDGRRVLIASTTSFCSQYMETPHGPAYVVQSPSIEIWSGLDLRPAPGSDALGAARRALGTTTRCLGSQCEGSARPIEKAAIAIDAADIDGDQIDEVVMSRCSYITHGGPLVNCHGAEADRSDSEVVVMTADVDSGAIVGLRERAAVPSTALDGGYREARLADSSGDGSLDLVAVTENEITVVCGRENMPDTGWGFIGNPQRIDATVGISQAFSLGMGQFDGEEGLDALVGGGLRAASPDSGIKLYPGKDCGFGVAQEALITGATTSARFLVVRTADLNADGFDDGLVLHRDTRTLELHFGSGSNILAGGPAIVLPAGVNGELAIHVENPGPEQTVVAVTTAPGSNVVHVIRVKPAPRVH